MCTDYKSLLAQSGPGVCCLSNNILPNAVEGVLFLWNYLDFSKDLFVVLLVFDQAFAPVITILVKCWTRWTTVEIQSIKNIWCQRSDQQRNHLENMTFCKRWPKASSWRKCIDKQWNLWSVLCSNKEEKERNLVSGIFKKSEAMNQRIQN